MRIRKDGRIEPFSHRPGVEMVLPGSTLAFAIYPALLICQDLEGEREVERVEIPVGGMVDQFTAQLDLERGAIRVWGKGAGGYFRYRIVAAGKSYRIQVERGALHLPSQADDEIQTFDCKERLSLGCHKQLDWDLVTRRLDMAEIFPVWLRLGQMVPPARAEGGSLCGLDSYIALFKRAFSGILTPRLSDESHWGGAELEWSGSRLSLLTEGAAQIRALFMQEVESELALLPQLPIPLHCGRFLKVRTSFGSIDFEWSKKRLRRAIIKSDSDGEVVLRLQRDLHHFRLRTAPNCEGELHPTVRPVTLKRGQLIYLDRFSA